MAHDDAHTLRLGIDLDGVVADFTLGWMTRYNREFAAELTPDQANSWNVPVSLTHFADMGEFWRWARQGERSIFGELPLYAGAIPALQKLAVDHRIVVVSSKFDWAIPDTLAWLSEHRFPSREIHFVWDKTSVDCDVYLEDAPHNLQALAAAHPDRTICRYVRAWNDPVEGAIDVHDWDEFTEVVGQRAAELAGAPVAQTAPDRRHDPL